ncbi:MAG: 50S ribosomal protein L2 [Puniceicoccales bacterium]|jgi:large subunit ribosomal protein L2|nr:50S ribosomal protein L2 [Puniceicoccales bacterium]
MAIVQLNPKTPSQRFHLKNVQELWKGDAEASLTKGGWRSHGRNCYGRITSRRRGGGHKRSYRHIDFCRKKIGIEASVSRIEYDPNRSANIALLNFVDGEKRYVLAPKALQVGDKIIHLSESSEDFRLGMSLPLNQIPLGVSIHCIELEPGSGAKIARSAGASCQLVSIEDSTATIKLPSGEIRLFDARCRATLGQVGNIDHNKRSLGKAGRNRWLNRRPRVRGVAMNPVDHPMGGGEGRSSGGGHPVSPWGQLAKGFPTRRKAKSSNTRILVRCNGKRVKK